MRCWEPRERRPKQEKAHSNGFIWSVCADIVELKAYEEKKSKNKQTATTTKKNKTQTSAYLWEIELSSCETFARSFQLLFFAALLDLRYCLLTHRTKPMNCCSPLHRAPSPKTLATLARLHFTSFLGYSTRAEARDGKNEKPNQSKTLLFSFAQRQSVRYS